MSKIVLEQIPYLYAELDLLKEKSLQEGLDPSPLRSRNDDNVDGIGNINLNESANIVNYIAEIKKLRNILMDSVIVSERNFDFIDIGTAFYGSIVNQHGEVIEPAKRYMLVEKNYCLTSEDSDEEARNAKNKTEFVSEKSALGKAVKGKIAGEICRVMSVEPYLLKIDSIDDDYSHYAQLGGSTKERVR